MKKQYSQNETTLAEKELELQNAQGTLGEMFGVVRRSAADAIGTIEASLVSVEKPGRRELLRSLAEAKELPTVRELEELWIAFQTEMTESAKVSTFDAKVGELNGEVNVKQVTRIGNFNLLTKDGYVVYDAATGAIQPLGKQPDAHILGSVGSYLNTPAGQYQALYLDPTRGALLRLNTQKATPEERFHQGETVGYIIAVLLIVGLLIAVIRLIDLTLVSGKIRAQLKNVGSPKENNPLGRILKVYHDNKNQDVENLELKLDEAILRETPKVERGINIINDLSSYCTITRSSRYGCWYDQYLRADYTLWYR